MHGIEKIPELIREEIEYPMYKNQIQKLQSLILAPYATKIPEENSRRYREIKTNFETRSEFQRDRDRIIHSTAFRRLMYKTQVFVNHEGDHYRTRMTHSLEVSQIARGIARSLGVNEDLVEAIALGHDLGHTPFGHAVEELLNDYLKNEKGFWHNLQSVRVVDIIEEKKGIPNGYGLNLTREVREGILKHNKDRTEGVYESLDINKPSGIEGQIVALVDTIAYVCHDFDDGMGAGIIRGKIESGILCEKDMDDIWKMFDLEKDSGVSGIINKLVIDLTDTSFERIRTNNIDCLEKVRDYRNPRTGDYENLITLGKYKEQFKFLKKFVSHNIYESGMTTIMDVKAQRFVKGIFETYKDNPKQLPNEYYKKFMDAQKFNNARDEYDGYLTTPTRVICDRIATMTDRSALETYDKLYGTFTKI